MEFPLAVKATVMVTEELISAEVTAPTYFISFFATILVGFWTVVTAVYSKLQISWN